MSAVALALAALFVLAVGHKASVIASGDVAAQPLLENRGLTGARATLALGGAAVAESAVVALLVLMPATGCLCAALLLIVYAREVGRLPDGRSCQCLGGGLDAPTAGGAVARNLVLAGVAVVTGVVGLIGAVDFGGVGQASAGLALVAVASGAAIATMQRRVERQRAVARHRIMMSKSTGGHVAD